jgi:hypothetical protein
MSIYDRRAIRERGRKFGVLGNNFAQTIKQTPMTNRSIGSDELIPFSIALPDWLCAGVTACARVSEACFWLCKIDEPQTAIPMISAILASLNIAHPSCFKFYLQSAYQQEDCFKVKQIVRRLRCRAWSCNPLTLRRLKPTPPA